MIVKPVKDHGIDFLASDLVRSPGVHASDIYGDLYKHLEPKRFDYGDEPPNAVLMALGTAWEKHFEYLLAKSGIVVERPEEFMAPPPDNIAFSPDLIQFNGKTRLWEVKLTSMALVNKHGYELIEEGNSLPQKFDKYLTQKKLYGYWLGIPDCVLAICSINKPWEPQFRLTEITFNDQELLENYQMCMNHYRAMQPKKKGKKS